jgi:exosortase family protein XrtF
MTETTSTLNSESKPSFFDNIKGNPLYWFLTKAVAFYLIWSLVPLFGWDTHSKFNDWLTWNIADQSAMVMRGIGFNAEASSHLYSNPDPIANPSGGPVMYNLIRIDGKALVHIEAGCNALVLMAFFAIFILAYPGPTKKKLWFIPLGIFIIHLINLGRVSLLSYNKYTHDANFDFNHKYLFSIVVYLAIFGLWMLWANKISGVKNII